MSMSTLDISISTIKGMRDRLTELGVTQTLFYASDDRNWIFTCPQCDKVIQFVNTATVSAAYAKHVPIVFVGDAFDGVDSVINKQPLNDIKYELSFFSNRAGSITVIVTSTVIHFQILLNAISSSYGTVTTITFAKLTNGNKVAFVTSKVASQGGTVAEGICTTNGSIARPIRSLAGCVINEAGNYFAMDFLVGSGVRAIGTVEGAKMLASPFDTTYALSMQGKHAVCPLANMVNNSYVINLNLMIENAI